MHNENRLLVKKGLEKINLKPNKGLSVLKSKLELENKIGKKPVIGCCGLSYKPNIDDLRESPAKYIVENLINQNQNVVVCEPNISYFEGINLISIDQLIEISDIIVFLVGHKEFHGLDFGNSMTIDLCGILEKN